MQGCTMGHAHVVLHSDAHGDVLQLQLSVITLQATGHAHGIFESFSFIHTGHAHGHVLELNYHSSCHAGHAPCVSKSFIHTGHAHGHVFPLTNTGLRAMLMHLYMQQFHQSGHWSSSSPSTSAIYMVSAATIFGLWSLCLLPCHYHTTGHAHGAVESLSLIHTGHPHGYDMSYSCLLYTSDAADE